MTPEFNRSYRLANELLMKQDLFHPFFDVKELFYSDKKISFDTIQNYCELTHSCLSSFLTENKKLLQDGCTIKYYDDDGSIINLILFNEDVDNKAHLNWTLAHEIGHVYMEHIYDTDKEEVEAHWFAAQLLMPEYTIHMMHTKYGSLDYKDIMSVFKVSKEAAVKRLDTLQRKVISKSHNDISIWNAQEFAVDIYYECNKNYNIFYVELENEHHEILNEIIEYYTSVDNGDLDYDIDLAPHYVQLYVDFLNNDVPFLTSLDILDILYS